MHSDELTAAVNAAADELRESLRGILVVVPDCTTTDKVNALVAIQRAAKGLRAKNLKRRQLLPPEGEAKAARKR